MYWVIEGDHKRCLRHPEVGIFGKADACPGCVADPGAAIEQPRPEESDAEALADERWCREQRDALLALGVRLAEERSAKRAKDRIGHKHVAKYYELALKYHRTAIEERRIRDERRHDRWLVEQKRKLMRRAVPN